ncbi:MAG: bacillithiol biosynthesis BshC, partial [bacterium]|nr:bacillithiol biosynthesis BshC [bacterium]
MFKIVKQHSWLETNLPSTVKAGLSGEDHESYPAGITECVETTGETTATGQQSGFGGGPLYTTFKRWTSETIAGTEGKSWFWVEVGDSDWNEIAHLSSDIPGAKWQDDSPGVPVGMRPLPKDFITKLGDRINRPEFSEVLDALRETSVMRSFTALQTCIAGNGSTFFSGLPFLIEPDETNFRNTISEWFLNLPDGLRALQTGIDRVKRRYGNIQAELFRDRTGWFWVESPLSKRIPLIWNGKNTFFIEELAFDVKGLSEFAKNGNGIFVPGALWRTVVQQALLEPQVVVVGPAEASYWGEVPELFFWTGLP